jgi:hypothetical protein
MDNNNNVTFWVDEKPETNKEYWQGARVYNLARYNSFEIKLEEDD